MIGTTLSHYRVLEKLGEGGMGVVYKAKDLRLERLVALKVLLPGTVSDPDRRRRFAQEARAASALQHPGIVSVFDIDEADGVSFIAMELVEGQTLSGVIGRRGLPVGEAVRLGRQIADALAAAHAAGIVHRDLKPANVLVTPERRAKLVDFGLAKLGALDTTDAGIEDVPTLGERTAEGTIVGTVAYMSPEQAEGKKVDSRSDVFAFGAVLHEMLTGRAAFARDSAPATLAAVLRDDPDAVAGIPSALAAVLTRCLRKDPSRRFQSMADVGVSLQEIEEELTSTASRAGATPAPRRRPLLWGGVSCAALALVGAGFWLGRHVSGGRHPSAVPFPLTSYAGICQQPALSPDGRQVAFAWNGEGQDNVDIYVKLVGPGFPLRLTTDPAADLAPAWSPDGTQIAFRREIGPFRYAIYLVPAMGGPERRVAEGLFTSRPVWTRDGSSLIVGRRDSVDSGSGLCLLSVGSGEVRRLTTPPAGAANGDLVPEISPDGRTVAFSRASSAVNSEIYLLPLTAALEPAGEPRRLTYEESTASEPSFTPDGRSVVFSIGAAGWSTVPGLRIIPVWARGEKAERLEAGVGGEWPSISPQGRLVYVRRTRDSNIWRVPLAGGAAPERLIFSTRMDSEPRFSPDGGRLTFCSDRAGRAQCWLANADGSGQRPLTSMDAEWSSAARWSPDGRSIVFISNRDGQMEIYRTTPDGQAPQRLTNHPAHDTAPSFSRDGRSIYFASNRDDAFQAWKMPAEGGAATRVTRSGGYAAIESQDGRTIYYAKRGEGAEWSLWSMPAGGGEGTRVLSRIATWGDFDVCLDAIVYVDSAESGARLCRHPLDGRPETTLATFEKRPGFGVSVSCSDGTVLFTQYDQESTELMLVEGFR